MSMLQSSPKSIEYWLPVIEEVAGGYHFVELIETPRSWLYLTTQYVYKIKKPLNIGESLNRSDARRRQACIDEARLNQRLAPEVYLGALPIVEESDGTLRLNGRGRAVEYAVKMRRLPADRNLIYLIDHGGCSEGQVQLLAQFLADFYEHRPPESVTLDAYSRSLSRRISDNVARVKAIVQAPLLKQLSQIRMGQNQFLERSQSLLNVRVCDGRIIDGHGDLRAEHVFFERRPIVIDCIEYSKHLRIVDPLDDLSCLAVDCDYLGRHDIAETLVSRYRAVTGDARSPTLELLYKSLHATSRAAEEVECYERSGKGPFIESEVVAWLDLASRYCKQLTTGS
jgi:uncharacterized protein